MTVRRLQLLLAAALALFGSAAAQEVTWEQMPLVPNRPGTDAYDVAFISDGDGGWDVLWIAPYGPLRYAPGDPDVWEGSDWIKLCVVGCGSRTGLTTTTGAVLIAQTDIDRLVPGSEWEYDVAGDNFGATDLFQTSLGAFENADGHGAIYGGVRSVLRSDDDGRPGSWVQLGQTGGEITTFGEVPPSTSLPDGRLLAALYNGVSYSDDGGATWTPGAGAYGFARYIGTSFAFVPEAAHPYGGAVLAGVDDLEWGRDSTATVYRSEDGGATWGRVHRFGPSALGLENANEVQLLTGPDGVIWAGVTHNTGGPDPRPGVLLRSEDGGTTWAAVGAGYGGHGVRSLVLGPAGRVYVGSDVGVWRTTAPVYAVATEAPSPEAGALALTVRPNPAGSSTSVSVRLGAGAPSAEAVVTVTDVRGREVTRLGGAVAGERTWRFDTSGWASGVYVVRGTAGTEAATATLTVVR